MQAARQAGSQAGRPAGRQAAGRQAARQAGRQQGRQAALYELSVLLPRWGFVCVACSCGGRMAKVRSMRVHQRSLAQDTFWQRFRRT